MIINQQYITFITLVVAGFSSNSLASQWNDEWSNCANDNNCMLIQGPCTIFSVNTTYEKDANAHIMSYAPFIDCTAEQISHRRNIFDLLPYCSQKKCEHKIKN